MPIIRVRHLHLTYPNGVEVLRGLDLDLYPGEIVALVGENGSGKTTLARLLAGLLRPTKGHIQVDGQDISHIPVRDLVQSVGLVFQNPDLQLFEKTVRDEVAFGPRNLDLEVREVQSRVEEELRRFELWEMIDRLPMSLSGGERKRVAFASTLALKPRVLLLDEPMKGMDHGRKARLAAIARQLVHGGRTVVFITHDMDFAYAATERTVVLHQGRVLLDGRTREVLEDPEIERAGLVPPSVVRLTSFIREALPSNPDVMGLLKAARRATWGYH